MSILDKVIVTKPNPPRITIYGIPGIGKTSLAQQFPKPFFLMFEEIGIVGITGLVMEKNFAYVWHVMIELLKEPSLPFKTLVIDNIYDLDKLIATYVLDNEKPLKNGRKPQSLAQCGFKHGYERAALVHGGFKGLCDKFTEKDISVIFIAHQEVTKHKPPDEEDYDIYNIMMNHTLSRAHYLNNVDAVLLCKQKSFTDTTESGRMLVRSTDERVIACNLNAGNVSKNRFSLPGEIPLDFNELKKYIPYFNQGENLC